MQPFEEVVAQHSPAVMRVCRALLGPVEADDAWLVTIAHRKAIDHIRARKRAPEPADDLSERLPAGGGGPEPDDTELHSALAALPFKQRGAVVYRYLADLPYAEVAALLECSEAAARRNAADGIARLRRDYQKDES
jgi:RNA polymerase sigma factor (sigma-70 family)